MIMAAIMISSGNPILNIKHILSERRKLYNRNQLSLYIHIPFCKSKCKYCDFNSYPQDPFPEYFDSLIDEISFFAESITGQIQSIYIGGGTPSLISPEMISRILSHIFNYFDVIRDAEITIEVNPESISEEKVRGYIESGVNRISTGIQSFNEKYLRILGRAGTNQDNIRALKILRSAGPKNISIDLMFGLPGQSVPEWLEDLKKLMDFEPQHISSYMLTPPETIVEKRLPSEETITEMFLTGAEYLKSMGWRHYEISNFAKKGYESRHNLNYWNWGEYLGFGAGAHSFIKTGETDNLFGIRWWNIKSPSLYTKSGEKGRVSGYEYIDREKALEELVMLGLRKQEGLDLQQLQRFIKLDMGRFYSTLIPFISGGFVTVRENFLKLQPRGMTVSNAIITEIVRILSRH